MLDAIGVEDIDDLFSALPEQIRFGELLDLPPARSELELQRELADMAAHNHGPHDMVCFMGGGAYDHFYPVLIDQLISRGEFLTAYTPYQAEASQGSLQAFFEFQTQIARLTALDIAHASMYEGAPAVAEAVLMAVNSSGKRRVLAASTLNPDYLAVLRTYLDELPLELIELPAVEGRVTADTVRRQMDDDTAAVVVQSPNIWGLIEDWNGCFEAAHEKDKTAAIEVFNPMACALLKKPGECGADIAAGEGQPLGVPLSFGGPYIGLFAATKDFVRKMPGRLIGRTIDADGRPAYCLTLQTREQHIRGAKATSNICTNEALVALAAAVYLAALGKRGLRQIAELCYHKAHYAAEAIGKLKGYSLVFQQPFFNEFVVRCPIDPQQVNKALFQEGIIGGLDISHIIDSSMLLCVTEVNTKQDMDRLVEILSTLQDGSAK